MTTKSFPHLLSFHSELVQSADHQPLQVVAKFSTKGWIMNTTGESEIPWHHCNFLLNLYSHAQEPDQKVNADVNSQPRKPSHS